MIRNITIFCISLLAFLSAVTPIDADRFPGSSQVTGIGDSVIQTVQQSWWSELVRHNYEIMEDREEAAL